MPTPIEPDHTDTTTAVVRSTTVKSDTIEL